MSIEVLTVSTKGQVSLPINMRRKMNISQGDRLAAYQSGDTIMLKPIKMPTESDFEALMAEAQDWAKNSGYREEDVNDIIKSVRSRNRR